MLLFLGHLQAIGTCENPRELGVRNQSTTQRSWPSTALRTIWYFRNLLPDRPSLWQLQLVRLNFGELIGCHLDDHGGKGNSICRPKLQRMDPCGECIFVDFKELDRFHMIDFNFGVTPNTKDLGKSNLRVKMFMRQFSGNASFFFH